MNRESSAADMLHAAVRPSKTVSTANRIAVEPSERQTVEPPKRQKKAKQKLRYTIDLEPDERRALRVFAFDHGVDASAVIKAVIRLLEHDVVVSDRVLDVLGNASRPKA